MQINNIDFIKTTNKIIKNDINKLYRGISVPLITIPLERSLQFYIYEKSKKNNNILYNSFITSVVTNSIFTPLSILNINIINSTKENFNNIYQFIKNKKKNIFYKGIHLEISKNYLSTFTYFYI